MMVKCKDCGMVGMYDKNGVMKEVFSVTREDGTFPSDTKEDYLVCVLKKRKLRQDIIDAPNTIDRISLVLAKEIECDGYYEWVPGLTPMDHFNMSNDERIRKESREERKLTTKLTIGGSLAGAVVGALISALTTWASGGKSGTTTNNYYDRPKEQVVEMAPKPITPSTQAK